MKTRTLENDADRIKQPTHLSIAFLAYLDRFILNTLNNLECMIALRAFVTVCRHVATPLSIAPGRQNHLGFVR
jgi:hypothetical protein